MFKILSIDGGGIKGVFPASFLSYIEELLEHPVMDHFDLIAGTSTGGILALGLGLGIPPADLLKFYKENGEKIFPASQTFFSRFKHYFSSKFKSDSLKSCLEIAFGEKWLGHSSKRLVIPSFSALTGKIYIYKTPHSARFEADWNCSAVDVAMATSAAPSYFPPYISADFIPHLDGGLWANNPTSVAVTEAVAVLKQNPQDIRVLSLGCTCAAQSFNLPNAGLWGWRKKALDAAFAGQSFGSMGIAALMVGHPNIQRVDPCVEQGKYSLDNAKLMHELEGLGKELARQEMPKFRELFAGDVATPFVPYYGPLAKTT